MKKNSAAIALLVAVITVGIHAHGDSLTDANRLLEVTNTGQKFEAMARRQTRDIIRSYDSIVSMSTEVSLPDEIRTSIAECYANAYAWEKFESGIAGILSTLLSAKQIQLLTDFYRSRGLPPTEIETFKDTIAMAEQVTRASSEYIFANSAGCVDQDARLIHTYLRGHPDLTPVDVELSD